MQVSSIGDISLAEMFLPLYSIYIIGLHMKCLQFTIWTRVTQILLHCKRLETMMDKWIAYVKCIVQERVQSLNLTLREDDIRETINEII